MRGRRRKEEGGEEEMRAEGGERLEEVGRRREDRGGRRDNRAGRGRGGRRAERMEDRGGMQVMKLLQEKPLHRRPTDIYADTFI